MPETRDIETPASRAAFSSADAEDVDAILESFGRLFSSGDMEEWSALFDEQSDFISWRGIWWTSREENRAAHLAVPPSIAVQLPAYRYETVKWCPIANDVVLAHGRWEWAGFVDDGEPAQDRAGLLTIVLCKGGEGWRIRAVQNTRTAP